MTSLADQMFKKTKPFIVALMRKLEDPQSTLITDGYDPKQNVHVGMIGNWNHSLLPDPDRQFFLAY
jgi:hypothetical protein